MVYIACKRKMRCHRHVQRLASQSRVARKHSETAQQPDNVTLPTFVEVMSLPLSVSSACAACNSERALKRHIARSSRVVQQV